MVTFDDLSFCHRKLTEIFTSAGLSYGCSPRYSPVFKGLLIHSWAQKDGQTVTAPISAKDAVAMGKGFENAGIPVRRFYEEVLVQQQDGSATPYRGPFVILKTYYSPDGEPVVLKGRQLVIANDVSAAIALIAPTPHFMAVKMPLLTQTLKKAMQP